MGTYAEEYYYTTNGHVYRDQVALIARHLPFVLYITNSTAPAIPYLTWTTDSPQKKRKKNLSTAENFLNLRHSAVHKYPFRYAKLPHGEEKVVPEVFSRKASEGFNRTHNYALS